MHAIIMALESREDEVKFYQMYEFEEASSLSEDL
jgi:hypothetical protein